MSQPFYQPARQSFSFSQNMQQPQGFGGGQGFGGFQQQSWGGGFGGNQGFGGFGGGGFQPQGFGFGGGFGGFGGGFNPYQGGFGGGYNPMFGGIGGLGFNPMMGPQFGMPMQGFNPYQQQDGPGSGMGGFGGMGAAAAQAQRTPIQFDEKMPTEQDWNLHAASAFYAPNTDMEAMKRDFMSRPMRTPRNLETPQQSVQASPESIARVQQFQAQFQPMYGGIGGLGFNPMMGPQFGMPMQQPIQPSSANETHEQYTQRMKMNRMLGFVAPQSMDRYSPMMEPQFGMPMRTMPSNLETLGPPNEDQLREHKAQISLMRQRAVDEYSGFNPYHPQQQAQLAAAQAAQMRAAMGI